MVLRILNQASSLGPPEAQVFQVFSKGIPAVSWHLSLINFKVIFIKVRIEHLDVADLMKKKIIVSSADIYQSLCL